MRFPFALRGKSPAISSGTNCARRRNSQWSCSWNRSIQTIRNDAAGSKGTIGCRTQDQRKGAGGHRPRGRFGNRRPSDRAAGRCAGSRKSRPGQGGAHKRASEFADGARSNRCPPGTAEAESVAGRTIHSTDNAAGRVQQAQADSAMVAQRIWRSSKPRHGSPNLIETRNTRLARRARLRNSRGFRRRFRRISRLLRLRRRSGKSRHCAGRS